MNLYSNCFAKGIDLLHKKPKIAVTHSLHVSYTMYKYHCSADTRKPRLFVDIQVKLLRSKDRFDSSGIGRSKGYAFIEFFTHEAAMAALRGTNNNPDLFGPKKVLLTFNRLININCCVTPLPVDDLQRLIVEFALEDSRALKLRDQRQRRQVK